MRSTTAFALLCGLFFVSGACGLTYQVLWLRLLALVFGVTVHAASTVLASFMAGLALGSLLARRLASLGHPLRVFALLEAGVAVSALATPAILDMAAVVYRPISAGFPDSLWLLTAARFVGSSAVLLLPTLLMGATLPILSQASVVRLGAQGSRLGALYAVNTAGALIGALSTGYLLIGGLGIGRTFQVAAAGNLLVAAIAWWLSGQSADAPEPAVVDGGGSESAAAVSPVAIILVMTVAGLASLALEIVWFRMLVQFLPATSYAFTTMLATVLGGMACGSAIAARLLTRPRHWPVVLGYVQAATGVVALLSLAGLGATYAAGWRTSGLTQGSAAAILPAAILMGVAFPIALRLWTGWPGQAAWGASRRRALRRERRGRHRRRHPGRLPGAAASRQPARADCPGDAVSADGGRSAVASRATWRRGGHDGRLRAGRGDRPRSAGCRPDPTPRARPARHVVGRRHPDVGDHPRQSFGRPVDLPGRAAPGVRRPGHGAAPPSDRPPADGAAPQARADARRGPRGRRHAWRRQSARHRTSWSSSSPIPCARARTSSATRTTMCCVGPMCGFASTTGATSSRSLARSSTSSRRTSSNPSTPAPETCIRASTSSSCATFWPMGGWPCSGSATGKRRTTR